MEVRYKFEVDVGIDLPSGSELTTDELTEAIEDRLFFIIARGHVIRTAYKKISHIPPKGILGYEQQKS